MKKSLTKNQKSVKLNPTPCSMVRLTAPYTNYMDEVEHHHHQWEHNLLSESNKRFIKNLPMELHVEREGVKIAIMHYGIVEDAVFAKPIDRIGYTQRWYINCR